MKKLPNPVGKLRRKTERSWELDKKVIDEKPPNLVWILRRKIDVLYVRL